MMKNFFTNPYLWLGGILGVGWYMNNKPTTKVAKIGESLKSGATALVDEATDFATGIVDTGVSTAKDIFEVFDIGDDVADVDAAGFDGKSSDYNIEDHDSYSEFDGDSNTGKCGVDIKDTDEMISPDDEGNNGSGFNGEGHMNFNDMDY